MIETRDSFIYKWRYVENEMSVAYRGMNCDCKLSFSLIVQRLGKNHLSTVWEINLEILSISLEIVHKHTNNNGVIMCLCYFF